MTDSWTPPLIARVLLVFEYGTLNGGEHSMLSVLPWLVGTEFEFVALAPTAGPLSKSLDDLGIPTIPFDLRDDSGQRRPGDAIVEELAKAHRRVRPDLVHGNSLSMGRLTGFLSAHCGAACTAHLRDIIGQSAAAVDQLNANRALAAVSKAACEFHGGQGVDRKRLHVVYNGVDCARFCPRQSTGWLKRELQLPDDAFLVATIGQICLRKGQNIFAQGAVQAATQMPRAHFLLVGERYSQKEESVAYEASIQEAFNAAGMAARFHRLGYRSHMDRLLGEIDLLVHSARQEPFGRVLLEAAAAERPIIATDVGGTAELLTHERSALLIPAESSEALAAAMDRLYLDPALGARLAAAAREEVVARFSIENASRSLADFWRKAMTKS